MGGKRSLSERERVGRIYAGYAASEAKRRAWSGRNPGNLAIRAELTGALTDLLGGDLAEACVLDVGCGSGWLLEALHAAGVAPASLHGIDILETRIDAARLRLPAANLRVGDCRSLPWGDGAFSLVTLVTVLSSLASNADVDETLAEARRTLAPGGLLAVYEPRLPTPFNGATRRVAARRLSRVLGMPASRRTLTLLPPLARRLGERAPGAYRMLVAIPALRSHALTVWRA
ncbi:MAG TPA: class I SAM-dependent methyltransferase [Thermoleophilaceae bacterium]|nr:class I SAM-dependent methyltransferase [Thermoleophilaceae bacterium]